MILRQALEELRLNQSIKHNTEYQPIEYLNDDGSTTNYQSKIQIINQKEKITA